MKNLFIESIVKKLEEDVEMKQRLYNIFNKMKQRCYVKTNKDYKNYGAKGITICEEWLNDINNFYDWAKSNGYASNLTLDRKDVLKGYNPKNCRWADKHLQSVNRNIQRNNTSGYRGVRKHGNQYVTEININGKKIYLGSYNDIKDAINARNNYIKNNKLEKEYLIQK